MRVFTFISLSFLAAFTGFAALAQGVDEDDVAAITLAGDGKYFEARVAATSDDAAVQTLITWMQLMGRDAPFATYTAFFEDYPDWPDQERLRARAELKIPDAMPDTEVVAFFAGSQPQTGQGAVRLGAALYALGQDERAVNMLSDVWLEERLTEAGHDAMVAQYPELLAPLHIARTDALLWRWRTAEATLMRPLLDEDHQAWLSARVGFIRKTGDETARLEKVPPELRDDAGLTYDRYNWLADNGRRSEAVDLLLARSLSPRLLGEPFRWSGWRRSLARWDMREGRVERAYQLASRHYLTDGSSFADLEWLSGYLSLTYLDAPSRALAHFEAARGAVTSPISVGRMEYWIARTHEVLGDPALAQAAFRRAAIHQTGYYGLLAAERLGLALDPRLTGSADTLDWQNSDLLENDIVVAALLLRDAGERGMAFRFFRQLGITLEADELGRLGALLALREDANIAVLLGKAAVTQDILVPSIYFPDHPLSAMQLPVEPALAMSIARRESEFATGAGSPVGALGLMQLMPGTAQEVAGFEGIGYSRSRLTTDWRYNARLGSAYLRVLEEQFGPSIVQIAAGYNAGPSRPEIWMDERGDPRLGEMDVVDWVEHIPFRETRNYVMRVSESVPVYRARLSGDTGPIRFTALLNGEKPIVRPASRPTGLTLGVSERVGTSSDATVRATDGTVTDDGTDSGSGDAASPLRPVGRPEG